MTTRSKSHLKQYRALFVLGTMSLGRSVFAFCPGPHFAWDKPTSSTTPDVYVSVYNPPGCTQQSVPACEGLSNIGIPTSTLERYTNLVMDSWYEDGQSEIRFEWKGQFNSADNPNDQNIVVRTTGCSSTACGPTGTWCACWLGADTDGDGLQDDASVIYYPPDCPQWDISWTVNPNPQLCPGPNPCPFDFVGAGMQEFGHAVGMKHPRDCGQTNVVSIMNSSCSALGTWRYARKDDVDYLIDIYGRRGVSPEFRQSTDNGVTWVSGTPALPTFSPDVRFGSSTTSLNVNDSIIHIAYPVGKRVWRAWGTEIGWNSAVVDTSHSGTTYNPASVAFRPGTCELVVAWLSDELTNTNDNKNLRLAYRNSACAWSFAYITMSPGSTTNMTTKRNGISVAYDPASTKWVVVWLHDGDRVAATAWDPTSGNGIPRDVLDYISFDAGAVVCNTSGADNCLITTMDSTNSGPCLHNIHGRVVAANEFQFSTDLTNCAFEYQTPYVTVDPAATPHPFKLSFTQANTTMTTAKKGTGWADAWQWGTTFSVTPFTTTGSIGFISQWDPIEQIYIPELDIFYVRSSDL